MYAPSDLLEEKGNKVLLGYWSNDKEFLNILGLTHIDDSWIVDPICGATFAINGTLPNNLARCFHQAPEDNEVNARTPQGQIPLESTMSDIKKLAQFVESMYY
jgi:hypothetical protein